jgi:PKD repeat protein
MDTAPSAGLSGYIIDISVVNPSIATISAVTYNTALQGMTDTTARPFTSGHIAWVDINEILQASGGETNVLLATITVKGLSPGSTILKTDLNMITDDKGNDMIPSSAINRPAITVAGQPVATIPLPVDGSGIVPTDPNGDGLYEDLNGDNLIDFNDVTIYFNNLKWIQQNEPVSLFDFNGNGMIDFGDIVNLNQKR